MSKRSTLGFVFCVLALVVLAVLTAWQGNVASADQTRIEPAPPPARVFAPQRVSSFVGKDDALLSQKSLVLAIVGHISQGGNTVSPYWGWTTPVPPGSGGNQYGTGWTTSTTGGSGGTTNCSTRGAQGNAGNSCSYAGGSGNAGHGIVCSSGGATFGLCSAWTGGAGSGNECSTTGGPPGSNKCSAGAQAGLGEFCSAMNDTDTSTQAVCSVEGTTDTSPGECSTDEPTSGSCSATGTNTACSVVANPGGGSPAPGRGDECTTMSGTPAPTKCSASAGGKCSVLTVDSTGKVTGVQAPNPTTNVCTH